MVGGRVVIRREGRRVEPVRLLILVLDAIASTLLRLARLMPPAAKATSALRSFPSLRRRSMNSDVKT